MIMSRYRSVISIMIHLSGCNDFQSIGQSLDDRGSSTGSTKNQTFALGSGLLQCRWVWKDMESVSSKCFCWGCCLPAGIPAAPKRIEIFQENRTISTWTGCIWVLATSSFGHTEQVLSIFATFRYHKPNCFQNNYCCYCLGERLPTVMARDTHSYYIWSISINRSYPHYCWSAIPNTPLSSTFLNYVLTINHNCPSRTMVNLGHTHEIQQNQVSNHHFWPPLDYYSPV